MSRKDEEELDTLVKVAAADPVFRKYIIGCMLVYARVTRNDDSYERNLLEFMTDLALLAEKYTDDL